MTTRIFLRRRRASGGRQIDGAEELRAGVGKPDSRSWSRCSLSASTPILIRYAMESDEDVAIEDDEEGGRRLDSRVLLQPLKLPLARASLTWDVIMTNRYSTPPPKFSAF